MGVFDYIQSLGATIMMPIILFLLGVLLGARPGKALKSGLTVGVGFIGLNLIIGEMGGNLGPAVQQMISRYGLQLSVIDVGWPSAAAIAFASQVGLFIIPIGLAVNVVMLLTNTTQTVDIDIWNYWHFAFTGSLVAVLTNELWMGLAAAVINIVIVMVLADYTAPLVEKHLNLPGVSLPHGFTTAYVPIAWLVNKGIDLIPGLKNIDINLEKSQKRIGVFGEPILLGTILGILIGVIAGYDVKGILGLGIKMGAVLVLIPKMAALLMEGLLPISEAASEFIKKRFKSRGKMYIGLDSAVGVGHPLTLAVSLILVPVAIFLAVIIPGNKVLPFTDLSVIPFMFVLIIPMVKGNGFRAIITGIITVGVGLLISTNLAPAITEAAKLASFEMPAGAVMISSICDGANPLTWILVKAYEFRIAGLVIMAVLSIGLALLNRRRILKEAVQLHKES